MGTTKIDKAGFAIGCEGNVMVAAGHTIQRRVESVYRCGVKRRPWPDESRRPGSQKVRAGATAFPFPMPEQETAGEETLSEASQSF